MPLFLAQTKSNHFSSISLFHPLAEQLFPITTCFCTIMSNADVVVRGGGIAVYICTIPQESDMNYSQESYTDFPNEAMKLYY